MSYMRTPRLGGSGEASPDSRSALARTATSVAAAGLRSPPPGGQGDASGGAELVRTRTANQQLTRQFSFANFDREFARCAPPPLPWKSDYIVSLCPALDIGKQYNRMRQRTAALAEGLPALGFSFRIDQVTNGLGASQIHSAVLKGPPSELAGLGHPKPPLAPQGFNNTVDNRQAAVHVKLDGILAVPCPMSTNAASDPACELLWSSTVAT